MVDLIKLNLGCGPFAVDDFIGVDRTMYPDVEVIADCAYLPFKDHSIDVIYALSIIEHFENPYQLLEEIYRVLKSRCTCEFIVPNVGTYSAEQDPTHKFVTDLAHWYLIFNSFFEYIKVLPFGVKFQSSSRKWIAKQIKFIEDGLWDLAQGFAFKCAVPRAEIVYQYMPHFMEEFARENGRTYLFPREATSLPLFRIDYSKYEQLKEDIKEK